MHTHSAHAVRSVFPRPKSVPKRPNLALVVQVCGKPRVGQHQLSLLDASIDDGNLSQSKKPYCCSNFQFRVKSF